MNRVSRITSILLITVLIFSLFSVMLNKENAQLTGALIEDFNHSDTVYVDIGTESDFVDSGWSGSGTELDPFVLDNQALGVLGDYGYLQIHDTTSHFVIRNCQMILMDIAFWSISNGIIEECTFINSSITIFESLDCALIDNEFSFNAWGDETVWLLNSSGCEIRENQFTYGFTGLGLHYSNDIIISDNSFTDFLYAGVSGEFANTTLVNNIFEGTGVRTEFWDSRIDDSPPNFQNNIVNGLDLGFFYSLAGAEIDGTQYGQIILGNCNNTMIIGGAFINCGSGLQIISSINCTLDGISVSDCSWQGITAERSARIRIVDCHVSNSGEQGIFLSQCPFYTIENCTLEDNIGGISPHIYSNNGTIVNCTIKSNKPPDSEYFAMVAGIYLSNNSTAIGNTITDNNVGILIYGGHCLVTDNVITHNGYGIYIAEILSGYGERAYANRIYGNDIGWSDRANAFDQYYYFTEWDDGVSIGNAWSDYYGIGYYQISRRAVDHFPRLLPEGGISLFFIHLGVGIPVSIMIVGILVVKVKRRVKLPA